MSQPLSIDFQMSETGLESLRAIIVVGSLYWNNATLVAFDPDNISSYLLTLIETPADSYNYILTIPSALLETAELSIRLYYSSVDAPGLALPLRRRLLTDISTISSIDIREVLSCRWTDEEGDYFDLLLTESP